MYMYMYICVYVKKLAAPLKKLGAPPLVMLCSSYYSLYHYIYYPYYQFSLSPVAATPPPEAHHLLRPFLHAFPIDVLFFKMWADVRAVKWVVGMPAVQIHQLRRLLFCRFIFKVKWVVIRAVHTAVLALLRVEAHPWDKLSHGWQNPLTCLSADQVAHRRERLLDSELVSKPLRSESEA